MPRRLISARHLFLGVLWKPRVAPADHALGRVEWRLAEAESLAGVYPPSCI